MRNIAKFKSAVLLILQNLWLDTLVFLSTRLVVVPNQIQYTAYVYENRVHILRMHYAPTSRISNVPQIGNYKMATPTCLALATTTMQDSTPRRDPVQDT